MSRGLLAVALGLIAYAPAVAQSTPTPPPQGAPSASTAAKLELDQSIVTLSTTMPLLRHHSYFRLTHRFARDLRRGDFGDLASDLFSLDNGAIIGLEYRFGITSRLQAGVHRSILGKTLVAFGRWDGWRQSDGCPVSLSGGATIEGQNNLRLDPQPGVWATISRTHGTRLALYASPTYVHNAHTATLRLLHEGHEHDIPGEDPAFHSSAHDTFFIGLGGRARVLETMSVVAEIAPRISGYKPARADWNAGVEKLTRGHVLQLNFGNNFNTTPGQIARGGSDHDVYLGFNLSRKW